MYLLSSSQLALYFMCSDSLFVLFGVPNPHYQYVTLSFSILNMAISKQNQLFSHIFFNFFESQCILHSKFCEGAGRMPFKIEFSNAWIVFATLNKRNITATSNKYEQNSTDWCSSNQSKLHSICRSVEIAEKSTGPTVSITRYNN